MSQAHLSFFFFRLHEFSIDTKQEQQGNCNTQIATKALSKIGVLFLLDRANIFPLLFGGLSTPQTYTMKGVESRGQGGGNTNLIHREKG